MYIITGLGIVSVVGLFLIISFTAPVEVGPLGVLVFFTTLYAAIFSLMSVFLAVFLRVAMKRGSLRKKDYLYTAVFAFGPIMLLMARAFGTISLWTISLIAIFILLIEFFVYKRI